MAVLAIPIALQSLVSFLVNLVDNIMIGQLGDIAVSGVYMGFQMFTLLRWFVTGITTSVTILATQYWGKQDTYSIKKITAIGFRIAIPVTLLFTIISFFSPTQIVGIFTDNDGVIRCGAEYLRIVALSFPFFCITQLLVAMLRSVENVRAGMFVSIFAFVVNILLNYLLIFGKLGFPALGVLGAAMATLISRITEAVILSIYTFKSEKLLKICPTDLLHGDSSLQSSFFHYGTPILIGEIVWGVNTIMRSYFMGHYSEAVIAAFSMTNLLCDAAFVWILALESATGIITGKLIGSSQYEKLRPYTYNMQVLFLLIGAISVGLLFCAKDAFIALYNVTPEAKQVAIGLIHIMIFIVFFSVYEDMTLCGIVKYGGETSFVLKTDSILTFLVTLPACLIASAMNAPAQIIYFLLYSDQILKCSIAAIKVNRFHWAHNITENENYKVLL